MYPKKIARPLQGMSSVAISRPKISISPGPTIVSIPLSFTPSMKNRRARLHFQVQNSPKIFTKQSKVTIAARVVLNPQASQMYPQTGAPTTAETVTSAEQQERKWSSLMRGMQMSLTLRTRQIRQIGMDALTPKIRRKRLSLSPCERVCTFYEERNSLPDILETTFSTSIMGSLSKAKTQAVFNPLSSSIGVYRGSSSFLSRRNDPAMQQSPANTYVMFDALKTFSATSQGKMGILCWLISAPMFWGLATKRNSKFQKIMPSEKATTATPLTLLRSLRKWDQRQLRTGMAPRQKQQRGITSQKKAKVATVQYQLITRGESRKRKAQILTAALYPSNLAKGLESRTAQLVGMSAQRRMSELVWAVTSMPWCVKQEKKQILQVPQMAAIPVANFTSMTPKRQSLAFRSAEEIILHIIVNYLVLQSGEGELHVFFFIVPLLLVVGLLPKRLIAHPVVKMPSQHQGSHRAGYEYKQDNLVRH